MSLLSLKRWEDRCSYLVQTYPMSGLFTNIWTAPSADLCLPGVARWGGVCGTALTGQHCSVAARATPRRTAPAGPQLPPCSPSRPTCRCPLGASLVSHPPTRTLSVAPTLVWLSGAGRSTLLTWCGPTKRLCCHHFLSPLCPALRLGSHGKLENLEITLTSDWRSGNICFVASSISWAAL